MREMASTAAAAVRKRPLKRPLALLLVLGYVTSSDATTGTGTGTGTARQVVPPQWNFTGTLPAILYKGVPRSYHLFEPSLRSSEAKRKHPLILALHGNGADAAAFALQTPDLTREAPARGYFLVFPEVRFRLDVFPVPSSCYTDTCGRTRTHIHTRASAHTRARAHTYTHTHTRAHTHTQRHTCIHRM